MPDDVPPAGALPYDALLVDDLGVMTGGGDDAAMARLVQRWRDAGLRTALVTNAEEPGPVPGPPGLFAVVVRSGEVGLRKPDPRIYRLVAARLGVDPARCLVVDDLPANVRGAAAAGMTGVLHEDVETTRSELELLLSRPV